jgi:adenylate cyclase
MSEARKIAPILVADVVGYSRLASVDEDRRLAGGRAVLRPRSSPTCP